MQFVTTMFSGKKSLASALIFCFFNISALAQINSPYSRFGLGDWYNSRHTLTKGMGGLATPVADLQSVNFINPASYSRLQTVTYDVGLEVETRKLFSPGLNQLYKSANLNFNYLALGLPILKDKSGINIWGLAFGLRPITKINYKINTNSRLPDIDSVSTNYEGSGGTYRAFIGTGFKLGDFSAGINMGYLFGQRDASTQRQFINDSLYYMSGMSSHQTSFSSLAADAGFQYETKISKRTFLRAGATFNIGGNLNASQSSVNQTFLLGSSGNVDSLDVVKRENNIDGTIKLPMGQTYGLAFEQPGKWMLGTEFENYQWSSYRWYGMSDNLANSTIFRVGGYFIPSQDLERGSYFNRITYRAGFFSGKDFIVDNGKQLPVWGTSLGFSFPIKRFNVYSNQFTTIHTSLEFAKRGNKSNTLSESMFKINLGLSLSDIWFQKRKFD